MLCDFGLYVWRRVVSLVIVAPGNGYHKKVEVRRCGWRYNGRANPVSKVEHETNKIKQSLPHFPRLKHCLHKYQGFFAESIYFWNTSSQASKIYNQGHYSVPVAGPRAAPGVAEPTWPFQDGSGTGPQAPVRSFSGESVFFVNEQSSHADPIIEMRQQIIFIQDQ